MFISEPYFFSLTNNDYFWKIFMSLSNDYFWGDNNFKTVFCEFIMIAYNDYGPFKVV